MVRQNQLSVHMPWFLRQINLLTFPRYCGISVKVRWEILHGLCSKFSSLSSGKNYENRLTFDKVISDYVTSCFYGPRCTWWKVYPGSGQKVYRKLMWSRLLLRRQNTWHVVGLGPSNNAIWTAGARRPSAVLGLPCLCARSVRIKCEPKRKR